MPLGGFVIASPGYYGHIDNLARTANSIIVGIVVAAVALIAAPGERSGEGTIP